MRGDGMPPREPPRRGLLSRAAEESRARPTSAPRGYTAGPGPGAAPDDPDDPYAPYRPYGSGSRLPMPAPRQRAYAVRPYEPAQKPLTGTMGRVPAVGSYTSTHVPALKHLRLGISIFHDGNPGHLWRGEFFSRLGEAVLAVGVVMWLAGLTLSPLVVAGAVVALALPYVLAGPLAARFEDAKRPDRLLKWIGRVRMVLALSLVAMHYRTILPGVYLVLFALSFLGRIRDALRTATIRTCLAPGEPEHVANDLLIGAAAAAVIGPLLATFFYILLGERVLLVSIASVALFAISANSETFLDPLPEKRRAFLLAVPDNQDDAEDENEEEDEQETLHPPSPEERREHALPEWYQQGPTTPAQAIADLRAGFGLAGSTTVSAVALWAMCAVALVGGGLATLEVFYLIYRVQLPEFYLGPLVAAEGAGLVLGTHLASLIMPRLWRVALFGGVAACGVALVLLSDLPRMPLPLLAALGLGAANALAVAGARHALTDGFDGVERRALARAESWSAAVSGVAGALLLTLFYNASAILPHGKTFKLPFPAHPIEQLLPLLGAGLVATAAVLAVLGVALGKRRAADATEGAGPALSGTRARLASLAKKDGKGGALADEDDADAGWGDTGMDAVAGDEWDEADDGGAAGGWDNDRYAASAKYERGGGWDDTGYGPARYDDGADDYDDRSRSRSPRGGSSARNRRPRW